MADFFTRLVSRTLSGLEPTVQPLIAPMYASGVTMADNYAVDTAPELGLSVSEEYASTESPMEQSPELLGESATDSLSLASNVTPPINLGEVQLPNNSSEITSGKPLEPDRAITPENSINISSPEESSPPIVPSNIPSTAIQKSSSQDTANVNPTSLESIQSLENSSEITSGEPLNPDRAITPELPINISSPEESSPSIAPLIKPATNIQKSTNQDTVNVKPTTIQPLDNPSEVTSGEPLNLDMAIAPESSINISSFEKSSLPIAPLIAPFNIIQKLSISDVKPASELRIEHSPLSEALTTPSSRLVESQVTDVNNNYSLGSTSTLSSPVGKPLNNKSDPARSRKVSLPLVQSEVIAPLSSFSPNSLGRLGPPVNKIESIPSKETEVFFESNVPAISNSFPQADLSDTAPSSLSYPSSQPQSQRNRIESNFSSHSNSFNSLEEKELVNRDGGFFEILKSRLDSTNTIPLKIKPRLEIPRQELPQSPEQLSELPFTSISQSPSRQLSQTWELEMASGSPRKIAITNAESTPTINITIGRVEVRGIKSPEPPPIKKSRAKTPQLSLSDYLKQRGGQ